MEENLVCEACNGSGFDEVEGRIEVCNSCFGLGYIRGKYEQKPLSEDKLKIKRAFVATFIALTMFYGAFSYAFIRFTIGPVETLIILLTGHLTAISFLVGYILHRAVAEIK